MAGDRHGKQNTPSISFRVSSYEREDKKNEYDCFNG